MTGRYQGRRGMHMSSFLRYTWPSCPVPPRSTLGSVSWGSSGGGFFKGERYLSPLTDKRTLVAGSLFPSVLANRWP
jgi:hypothetical protein